MAGRRERPGARTLGSSGLSGLRPILEGYTVPSLLHNVVPLYRRGAVTAHCTCR
jgi:hypothetical protein